MTGIATRAEGQARICARIFAVRKALHDLDAELDTYGEVVFGNERMRGFLEDMVSDNLFLTARAFETITRGAHDPAA